MIFFVISASKSKRGRKSKVEKFPAIVEKAREFIEESGFSAHEKRTENAGRCGRSLHELKSHLEESVPNLKADGGISVHTIHRLMVPPSAKRKASERYKSLISAKVGKKTNCKERFNIDSHFARAQVKYALEMGDQFSEEIVTYSCDAKAKVMVGTSAVSRHTRMRAFVSTEDMPLLDDHDFPPAEYGKIVPVGVMELVHKPGTETVTDNQDREHSKYGRTGPLRLVFRANKFNKDNAFTHKNDLSAVIQHQNKSAVIIVCDNGPDWNKTSLKTFVAMGRLWQMHQLDYLCMIAYAAGDSKYNPIEHAWSPITFW